MTQHPKKISTKHLAFLNRGLDGPKSIASPTRPKNAKQRLSENETPSPVVLPPPKQLKDVEDDEERTRQVPTPPTFRHLKPYASLRPTQKKLAEDELIAHVEARNFSFEEVSRILGKKNASSNQISPETFDLVMTAIAQTILTTLGQPLCVHRRLDPQRRFHSSQNYCFRIENCYLLPLQLVSSP